ncbi:MAG: sulfatase-like hydrolase/transferase [Bacteroidales bacterium]|nr:sulfatase-like hydrolase/transferase [Bacteroidales bacterium]
MKGITGCFNIIFLLLLSVLVTNCRNISRDGQKDPSGIHEKPNIMIWVADDQYLASVGCYGGDPVQTPNIDKFATEGLRFTRAYSTSSIYVSDNGSNTPRSKYTLYETGVNVPMIIRWPSHLEPGTITHQLVDFTDVMPTLMEIADAEPGKEMDGISLLPLLRGEDQPLREDLFLSFTCLGVNDVYEPYPIRAVVTMQYKLIHYLNHIIEPPKGSDVSKVPEYELFDLIGDLEELKNLAYDASYTGILDQMKSRLEKWTVSVGDKGMETENEAVAMFPDKPKELE